MAFYLIDTNILIDLAGKRQSTPFFDRLIDEPGLRLGTHILCLAEYMAGASSHEEAFLNKWLESGELEIIYLDAIDDAIRAGKWRRQYSLTLPDALILASAARFKAHLLTNDDVFLKKAKTLLAATDPMTDLNH